MGVVQKVLPCLNRGGGVGAKGFGPAIFPFCTGVEINIGPSAIGLRFSSKADDFHEKLGPVSPVG